MNKPLTAQEMIHLHQNPIKTLNLIRYKKVIPENSEEESNTIRQCLEAVKKNLSAERVERRHNRSEAIWLEEKKHAKITRRVGNIYPQFGCMEDNDIYLSPNETILLLLKNRLEVLWNGVPLSIEQAFTVLLDSKNGLDKYKTYQELTAKGYKVVEPDTSTKRKLDNTEILKNKKLKSDKNKEDTTIFERLKSNGPTTSANIELSSNYLYNLYLPCVSIKDKTPDHGVIIKPDENQFSLQCVSENNLSLLTSFTGNESVSFYQFHKVDLDNS